MFSQVLNGAYKGYGIRTTLNGKVLIQKWKEKVYLDDTTIKSYEIMDKSEGKSSVAKTIGLGAIFGMAGALAGANSKKGGKTTIKITWKNGDKSIIELDKDTFKVFLRNCPVL